MSSFKYFSADVFSSERQLQEFLKLGSNAKSYCTRQQPGTKARHPFLKRMLFHYGSYRYYRYYLLEELLCPASYRRTVYPMSSLGADADTSDENV